MNHERRRGWRWEFLFLVAITVGTYLFNLGTLVAHFQDTRTRLEHVERRIDDIEKLLRVQK